MPNEVASTDRQPVEALADNNWSLIATYWKRAVMDLFTHVQAQSFCVYITNVNSPAELGCLNKSKNLIIPR